MVEKVCAGIVTYNPDLQLFLQCLSAIKEQVNEVYIYDNGSHNSDSLYKLIDGDKDINIFFNNENVGIAKALNELCKTADNNGYTWIVTMDQDSVCANNMIENLLKYTDDGKIGIIAPRVEFRESAQLIHETKNKSNEEEKIRACITSGSLTRIEAWKKVGGFDEWFFIDHVDNEFCTNLIIHGYEILRINKALLYQRAGEMKYISIPFGKKILLPYYSQFRNYYICRNTVYYLRKYKKQINYQHELCAFVYSQCVKILFEKNRIQSIKSTFKGIIDGRKGP